MPSGSFELRQKHVAVGSHGPLPCFAKKLEKRHVDMRKEDRQKVEKRKKKKENKVARCYPAVSKCGENM